jgi:hypothetical protein
MGRTWDSRATVLVICHRPPLNFETPPVEEDEDGGRGQHAGSANQQLLQQK